MATAPSPASNAHWIAVYRAWLSVEETIHVGIVTGASLARLTMLSQTLELVALGRPDGLRPEAIATMNIDLAELGRRVASLLDSGPSDDERAALDVVVERLLSVLSPAAVGLTARHPGSEAADRAVAFTTIGDAYGEDARTESHLSVGLYLATFVIGLLAAGGAWLGADRAGDSASEHLDSGQLLASLAVPAVLVTFGVLLLRQAELHRRRGSELARLQRQYVAVEPYFSSLPSREAALLRGLLLPQLFPRILEDDDPMRATAWARPEDLLKVLAQEPPPSEVDAHQSDPR